MTEVVVKKKRRLDIWTYVIDTTCSVCGGKMKRTNITYTVDPPLYEYKCEQCQRTAVVRAEVLE